MVTVGGNGSALQLALTRTRHDSKVNISNHY